MLSCNERSFHAHWLGGYQSISAAGSARGRDLDIAAANKRSARRTAPKRLSFSILDRLVFVGLYGMFPRICDALAIVKPETIVRWHRAGFRLYWRWKSLPRGGRPTVPPEIRKLIGEMSIANPLWGAPRIHGELLKLGIEIGQTSVAKYMARRRGPPSQGWRTFLRNHADGIVSMDLFVVPTASFQLLYGLLILEHGRRQIMWLGATAPPTAEWITRQLTEAYVGKQHRNTWSVIATLSTVIFSSAVFGRWAFVTGRLRRDGRGKTDMPNG